MSGRSGRRARGVSAWGTIVLLAIGSPMPPAAARADEEPTDEIGIAPSPPSPYRDLSGSGAEFPGPGRDLPPPAHLATVRIGLLGPGRGPAGARLREGAMLAVTEANERGGLYGLPYETVFRADDGPWGVGAQQVTALAYEDSVWAVLGGLEGGNAHLAELVAAKLWVPVVTPTASDFTIDYANVPWVFRCAPSDARQARELLGCATGRGARRVLAYVEDDREGRTGRRRLEEAIRSLPMSLVTRAFRPSLAADVIRDDDLRSADAVVIWTRSEPGHKILSALRETGFDGLVLAPATFLSPASREWPPSAAPGDLVVAAPCHLEWTRPPLCSFAERYRQAYDRLPDPVSLQAYDATRLVIDAIERAGLNRARIRDALAGSDFPGLTGSMHFDSLGGSRREAILVTWQGDGWVALSDGGGSGTGGRNDGRSAGGEPSAAGR